MTFKQKILVTCACTRCKIVKVETITRQVKSPAQSKIYHHTLCDKCDVELREISLLRWYHSCNP